MKLTPTAVETIFNYCQEPTGEVVVEGIVHHEHFSAEKLAEKRTEIAELLAELPDQFQKSKGGGWSFLNACNDRHGTQWTGFHLVMEMLFMLGMATGQVECLLPRDMWSAMPGGMPYYVVIDKP